jgi:type I restriction enzyme R subunit
LPQASFIGFTGTPIDSSDANTREVFGDRISIYGIQDTVDDRATVPIHYESRLAKPDIHAADIEALNDDVEEVIEDDEDVASREKTKSNWSRLEILVGAEPRIKQVANHLLQHFANRTKTLVGKGILHRLELANGARREWALHQPISYRTVDRTITLFER